MKRINYFTVILVTIFLMSVSASATGTRTEFKAYEIEELDNLYMGKEVRALWTLRYSLNEEPVTVVKRKTLEGTEYVVHSKFFEVSYASTADGFGTKEVRRAWSDVPKKITRAVINDEELARQRIITPNKVTDEKALGLIASYLPDLINDGYTHLLN
ncbi:hypothetical protein OU798_23025 [Prolixibacteraceae bacterium Z1-6]|uniref:Lipocalin-like domain-containing protein n=1 Tax=Draconibacterium aestuarii TaxID=2998507 RepID=A0A9X3J958_9BACT|nr:hypothetical protein [Prolixibacteraceae bacterium Z1-6]